MSVKINGITHDNCYIDDRFTDDWVGIVKWLNDGIIAKDPLYCSCVKPDSVLRGFAHTSYQFCTKCKKEVKGE
jgi:hypothetical protein